MSMIIDGVDFQSLPAERYWQWPSGYKKNKQDEIYAMIMSNAYIGSRKMDGAYYRFIKDMDGNKFIIETINSDGSIYVGEEGTYCFSEALENYTFDDGIPFGVKA